VRNFFATAPIVYVHASYAYIFCLLICILIVRGAEVKQKRDAMKELLLSAVC
jgi:hypothetical protein